MPKKTKTLSEPKTKLGQKNRPVPGLINKINFTNFSLFGKKELNFHAGLNIIKISSLLDKILLNFILKLSLNIEFYTKNKKLDDHTFYLLNTIKEKSEKSLSFLIELFIDIDNFNTEYNQLKADFINENKIHLEFCINNHQEIELKIFQWKRNEFVLTSPVVEFTLSQLLRKISWQDESFFPYYNYQTIQQQTYLTPASFYTFILNLLEMNSVEKYYYELKEKQSILELEQANFIQLKENAFERKSDLENEIKTVNEIKVLEDQINEIELEKGWSGYFDLKGKFEGKTANIEQIKSKLESIKSEKSFLEVSLDEVTKKLENLHNELDSETNVYENKRKNFLSEKASLDRIERNLKDWDSTTSKTEKELKFKTMKLRDKEKKLNDIEARLSKGTSKALEDQKTNLEIEIKKDKNELETIQERLNAVTNEKTIKLKEKAIKEKKSNPLSSQLANISSKLESITNSINQKDKDQFAIKESLTNLKKTQESLEKQLNSLESELKELIKNITAEEEDIKKKQLKKPQKNRSLATLTMLQNQLNKQKSELTVKVSANSTEDTYQKHLSLIEQMNSEIVDREHQLKKIDNLLQEWKDQWNITVKTEIKELNQLVNDYLNNSNIAIDLNYSASLLPDQGALYIKFWLLNNQDSVKFSLNDSSMYAFQILFCLILSSISMKKSKFSIFDLLDVEFMTNDELNSTVNNLIKKESMKDDNDKTKISQIVFLVNDKILSKISEVQELQLIN